MLKYVSTVFLVFFSFNVQVSHAEDLSESFIPDVKDGILLSQTKQWGKVAKHWKASISRLSATDDDLKNEAALMRVFQTISLEQMENASAYDAWSKAIGEFLENGATWEQERERLALEISDIQSAIESRFASEVMTPSGRPSEFEVLYSLNEIIQFTSYDGPKPGLTKNIEQIEVGISVARNYFPRISLREESGEESKGRHAGFEDQKEEENSSAKSIGRSIRPIEKLNGALAKENQKDNEAAPDAAPTIVVEEVNQKKVSVDRADASSANEDANNLISESILEEIGNEASEAIRQKTFSDGPVELTASELEIGKRAWRYFVENRQTNTGLFNSVDKYPYMTMWDFGSSLAALHCAHDIGLIDQQSFEKQMTLVLGTLEQMPLFRDAVPNREYDTRSGLMTNLKNKTSAVGSGYSSIDLARTLTWLFVVSEKHEIFQDTIKSIVNNWQLADVIKDGEFYRVLLSARNVSEEKQEGRLGYEQYIAIAFDNWGFSVNAAMDSDPTKIVKVEGVPILKDTRSPDFLNLEPFLLIMLEYEKRPAFIDRQVRALLQAHRVRFENSGELSLFSEDSLDTSPWFLYNIIASDKGNWICKNFRDEVMERCQSLSTKAYFAVSALYDLKMLETGLEKVAGNFSKRTGYYSGFYGDGQKNRSLTINTNAIILESLAYKKRKGHPFVSNSWDSEKALSQSRLAN